MQHAKPPLSGTDGQRSLALFPGSFKPPHAAHLFAIEYLLQRPDVETVVVIISNRCRIIPGTTLAIDADSAHVLLKTMLHCLDLPLDRIRIEIAEHRAVSHALDYLKSTDNKFKLLFCIGATDHSSGDDRFKDIEALSRKTGVPAAVIALPTQTQRVRASHMRKALAGGMEHRDDFLESLPNELDDMQKLVLWAESRSALQPIEKLVRNKLAKSITDLGEAFSEDLQVIDPDTVDPVFRLARHGQPDLIIKYAGESVGDGSFAGPKSLKPARRLAVEKRALNHVRKHLSERFTLPDVFRFDRVRRVLVLTDAEDGMTPLNSLLRAGDVSEAGASLTGMFLGELHRMEIPQAPFWGSRESDQDHWNELLQHLANTANAVLRNGGLPELCQDLPAQCEDHVGEYVLHLDFCAENLAFGSNSLFVSNFERSACFGDPAFDLATLTADYLRPAHDHSQTLAASTSIRAFLAGYQAVIGELDSALVERIFLYAAFLMLKQAGNITDCRAPVTFLNQQHLAIKILRVISLGDSDPHFRQSDGAASRVPGSPTADLLQNIFCSSIGESK